MRCCAVTLLLTCIVAVAMVGCARNTTSNIAEMRIGETDVDKRVIINHRGFAKRVSFETLEARRAGDILQARVEVQNHKKKTIPFVYRFEWFDKDGFPVESGVSIWKNGWLKGKQTLSLVGTAPNAKAADVRLHIRQVK